MKKLFTRAVSFALIVCTLALMLAACGPVPAFDIQKAAANLEAEGYTVRFSEEDNDIGVVKTLHAQKKVEGTLEEIQMTEFETVKLAKIEVEKMRAEFKGAVKEAELCVEEAEHILDKYADELDDDAYEKYSKKLAKYEQGLQEYKRSSCGRFGKVVWGGSKNAIKAAK